MCVGGGGRGAKTGEGEAGMGGQDGISKLQG